MRVAEEGNMKNFYFTICRPRTEEPLFQAPLLDAGRGLI